MKAKIKEVNEYLRQNLWMDFCVSNIKEGMVQIDGSMDFSWNKNSIELLFKEAIYISTVLYEWHKSEEKDFIIVKAKNGNTALWRVCTSPSKISRR